MQGQRVALALRALWDLTARTFNEDHVLAIAEAISRYRTEQASTALLPGRDTHALRARDASIVEVLCAHGVDVMVDADDGFTPTPPTARDPHA